ncbi:hypothetical protein GUJ93_ZPchr0006g43066 [Zizania palustris]|uniref:Uncharacterized protein n=1 Tax=Zizania palustris TaxID=103762 RepID=A0A8J5VSF9_ZIZPA|nr:hypothetical protein GUJ93_ZPchr0006g43066 [Zizania palustris]
MSSDAKIKCDENGVDEGFSYAQPSVCELYGNVRVSPKRPCASSSTRLASAASTRIARSGSTPTPTPTRTTSSSQARGRRQHKLQRA